MNWTRIDVPTRARTQFLDITGIVAAELAKSGVESGTCSVYMPHTTAGLTINENADPDVARDILAGLTRLVPETGDYRHAEGNSDAHIKASLMGFSVMVPVYFCEFDGPRHRHVLVGITGDGIGDGSGTREV